MRELWKQAFREFEKLSVLTAGEAEAHLRGLRDEQPELAKLIERIQAQPAISLPPIAWADADDATATASSPGARLGAYTLIREIGRGGTGSVWLGERADGLYHGQVAIKFMNAPLLQDVSARQRFEREGELLARLSHPNIARLLDAGTSDRGARYLVLEYVDGVALGEYCAGQRLGIEATITLFCQAVDAVAYSHAQLILHRDIKPGNMLVTADGQLKLLDFGLGKLLHEDEEPLVVAADMTRMLGIGYTPRYASPEQMRGSGMTTASDVYSLGVTLYELLTGAPFESREHYTRPSERLAGSSARSTWSRRVRGDIDSIVAKAVSDAPEERYANAAALGEDLRRFLNHEPVTAQPDTTLYRAGKFVRRHRLAVGSAALTTLLVLVALIVSVTQTLEARKQREYALQEGKSRDAMLNYVTELISVYAPRDRALTSVQLLELGVDNISKAFKDDHATCHEIAQLFSERLSTLGERETALRAQQLALACARQSGEPLRVVDALSLLAHMYSRAGDAAQADALLIEAEALLPSVPKDLPRRGEIATNVQLDRLSLAVTTGDAGTAVRIAEALLQRFAEEKGPTQLADATLFNRGAAAYNRAMRYADSLAMQDRAMQALAAPGDGANTNVLIYHSVRLYTLLQAGDPAAAVRYIEARVLPGVRGGLGDLPADLFARMVMAYVRAGDITRAREMLAARPASADAADRPRRQRAEAEFWFCVAIADARCAQRAMPDYRELIRRAYASNPAEAAALHWADATLAMLGVDRAAASRAVEAGLQQIAGHTLSASPVRARLLAVKARLLLDAGTAAEALAASEEGLAYLREQQKYPPERCIVRAELLALASEAHARLGNASAAARARDEANAVFRNTMTQPRQLP